MSGILPRLDLNVHGVTATLHGDAEALDTLAVHFWAYCSTRRGSPDIAVELIRGDPAPSVGKRSVADQVVDRGVVYNEGDITWIDHHGYAFSRYDFASESGLVRAPRVEDLVEIGYLMLHSRLGRLLEERRGLYRLHCLGVCIGDRAALVLAPSGGGKSSLALAVLSQTRLSLLGDDMVLVDGQGRAHPFQSPLGVKSPEVAEGLGNVQAFPRRLHPPKWLLKLEGIESRLARKPARVDLVLLARRVSRPPNVVVPVPHRVIASALWRDLVVGLGLPQVLELVARRGARDLTKLAPTAIRRSAAALALVRHSRGAVLELSDPEGAASEIAWELRGS